MAKHATISSEAKSALSILNSDGSNYVSWNSALEAHLLETYGSMGKFASANAYTSIAPKTREQLREEYNMGIDEASNTLLDATYTDYIRQTSRRVESQESDKIKIFGLLTRLLSKDGLEKVKEHDEWSNVETATCPLKYLRLIRLVHNLRMDIQAGPEAQYTAMSRYNNLRQIDSMSNNEYRDAFKLAIKNLTTLDHPNVPSDADAARHFFMTLDVTRHKEFINTTMNAINRPSSAEKMFKTINECIKALNSFVPSVSSSKQSNLPAAYSAEMSTGPPPSSKPKKTTCTYCKKKGHVEKDCRKKQAEKQSDSKTCTYCKKRNHTEKDCRKKANDAKKNIEANVAESSSQPSSDQQFYHQSDQDNMMLGFGFVTELGNISTSSPDKSSDAEPECEYVPDLIPCDSDDEEDQSDSTGTVQPAPDHEPRPLQVQMYGSVVHEKSWQVSYDTMANHSFAVSDEMLINVRDSSFVMSGVNGKDKGLRMGTLPCFGDVAITPNSPRNGLAACQVEKRFKVCRVQGKYFKVIVTDDFAIYFRYDSITGFYTATFDSHLLSKLNLIEQSDHKVFLSTVSDIRAQMSKDEIKRAETARSYTRKLHYPSDQALQRSISNGVITNSEITRKDLMLANQLFGPTVESLKGKTKDYGTTGEYVEFVPRSETKEQSAHVDVFTYRGVSFLLLVINPLQLLMTRWLPGSVSESNVIGALNQMFGKVKDAGYTIQSVTVDPGAALVSLDGKIGFPVNPVGPRTHVPVAEAYIRVIKERVRCTEHGVPFHTPKSLLPHLVYSVTGALNSMLKTEQTVSSRESFTGTKFNAKLDMRCEWGEYCQVHVAPDANKKNTHRPRAVSAIAMCPVSNNRGTWIFYDFKKKSFFRADRWTRLPMPDIVIELINQTHDADETASKFKSKSQTMSAERRAPPTLARDIVNAPTHPSAQVDSPDPIPDAIDVSKDDGDKEPSADSDQTTQDPVIAQALQMSVKAALKTDRDRVSEALKVELTQLVDKDVWIATKWSKLTNIQKSKAIRCYIFMKEKRLANGDFDKWKARLVAGGNGQDASSLLELYDTLSSPTVAHDSVMIMLAIAAVESHDIATVDVSGAYLECSLDKRDEVYMIIPKEVAYPLCDIRPEYRPFIEKEQLLVKLVKALYGTKQASKLWYDKLRGVLKELNLTEHPYDPCLYTGEIRGAKTYVLFHVDDLMITSKSTQSVDHVVNHLEAKFKAVTKNRGSKHSYLSMNISSEDDGIYLDMTGYIARTVEGFSPKRRVDYPANDDLFKIDDHSPKLDKEKKGQFHSHTARLLFLSKRTRMDIQTVVSHLTTRVQCPNTDEWSKLERVMHYLACTPGKRIKLSKGGKVKMSAFVDASYGTHHDGTSRTGIFIFMAGACICGWTHRQKLIVISSTEAEIVAFSEGNRHIIWVRRWLRACGFDTTDATVVHQDNQACITLMNGEGSPKNRTKHMDIRYFFVREHIKSGDIRLVYTPTKEMIADLLTKPVTGSLFAYLTALMFGCH